MNSILSATHDSATMFGRDLRHTIRFPLMLIASIGMPVLLLLLFVYVFGNTLSAGLSGLATRDDYLDYLVPGLLVMTVAAGTSTTAVGVCADMTEGIINRFRTMPIARGAVLVGHVGGSVVRTLITTAAAVGVAYLVGFRPSAGLLGWLGVFGILAAFTFVLAWLSVALGLVTGSPAGANSATLPIQLVLPFLSSTFIPTDEMPAGIRWFAEYQPLTPIVESIRALLMDTEVGSDAVVALAWCAALSLVGYLWARSAFRRGVR